MREGLSGQTILVARASFAAEPTMIAPPSPPALKPATTGTIPRPARRTAWIAVFALSLVAAGALGGAVAWVRRQTTEPPSQPAATNPDAADIDDDLPLNDEELHKVVDKYLHADKQEDAPVAIGLCLELMTRYLDQHRLDDAEKFSEKLEGIPNVKAYPFLGRLGRAIVLALRSQAVESNRLFREIFPEQFSKEDLPKRLGKIYTNPQFRFWLAQAASYNIRNGMADKNVPSALKWLAEPPKRP